MGKKRKHVSISSSSSSESESSQEYFSGSLSDDDELASRGSGSDNLGSSDGPPSDGQGEPSKPNSRTDYWTYTLNKPSQVQWSSIIHASADSRMISLDLRLCTPMEETELSITSFRRSSLRTLVRTIYRYCRSLVQEFDSAGLYRLWNKNPLHYSKTAYIGSRSH